MKLYFLSALAFITYGLISMECPYYLNLESAKISRYNDTIKIEALPFDDKSDEVMRRMGRLSRLKFKNKRNSFEHMNGRIYIVAMILDQRSKDEVGTITLARDDKTVF